MVFVVEVTKEKNNIFVLLFTSNKQKVLQRLYSLC